MPKKEEIDVFGLFQDKLNQAAQKPTIHSYIPHRKQVNFHSQTTRGRLYIGGNRSGKTVGGIVEDIWWLTGKHPYQNTPPPPVKGRIVTVSFTEGIEMIIMPELAEWLPPSELINGSWEDSYSKALRTLTLANGSQVELMSYDQELKKFAGTSRHFTHFDEEPPQDIFTECKLRLLDTKGHWWITMTPVEGMTWTYDDLYTKHGKGITVIEVDTSENPHIDSDELAEVISGLSDDEQKARKSGKYVQIGGLVFGKFLPEHVLDIQLPPLNWTHYASVDHGYNNPTAWLWHAVSPQGHVLTYDEIYLNETLVHEFAQMIKERNSLPGRREPDIYVGDPSMKQRNAQTGDSIQGTYAREGIPIVMANNDVTIGVEKMNRYLDGSKWGITSNCHQLIKQLQRVRWKTYTQAKRRRDLNPREEIHKKDDHATDSARYFFSMMPSLYIPTDDPRQKVLQRVNTSVREALHPTTSFVNRAFTDPNLGSAAVGQDTEWNEVIDETVGGIY